MIYWIPIVIIYYIIYAILSQYGNTTSSWRYTICLIIMQTFALWPFVIRYSSNIVRDGLVYDAVIVITFYATLLYISPNKHIMWWHYVGAICIIVGLLLLKIEGK